MNIALSPLNLSPNNYIAKMKKPFFQLDKVKQDNKPDIVIMD